MPCQDRLKRSLVLCKVPNEEVLSWCQRLPLKEEGRYLGRVTLLAHMEVRFYSKYIVQ